MDVGLYWIETEGADRRCVESQGSSHCCIDEYYSYKACHCTVKVVPRCLGCMMLSSGKSFGLVSATIRLFPKHQSSTICDVQHSQCGIRLHQIQIFSMQFINLSVSPISPIAGRRLADILILSHTRLTEYLRLCKHRLTLWKVR